MMKIAIIGGTGKLGSALAGRWAEAGLDVVIGSRTKDKAIATAEKLSDRFGKTIMGLSNADAARAGDVIVVTVPFGVQSATLAEISPYANDKIVVDTTVPLAPPKVMRVQLPTQGSAALIAQQMLPNADIVSAFHNVAAHRLALDEDIRCDVLVFGDKPTSRKKVVELCEAARLRGVEGGPLCNSAAAEALTSVLIFINKTYAVDGAGIEITGVSAGHG